MFIPKAILTSSVVAMLVLAGCTTAPQEAREAHRKGQELISESHDRKIKREAAAEFTTQPQVNLNPIKKPDGPSWLRHSVEKPIRVSSMPFDLVVD